MKSLVGLLSLILSCQCFALGEITKSAPVPLVQMTLKIPSDVLICELQVQSESHRDYRSRISCSEHYYNVMSWLQLPNESRIFTYESKSDDLWVTANVDLSSRFVRFSILSNEPEHLLLRRAQDGEYEFGITYQGIDQIGVDRN